MPFNLQQPTFQRLCISYAERRKPIVFWIGAGLSVPGGFPTWTQLRSYLIDQALETLATRQDSAVPSDEAKVEQAKVDANLWDAFQLLHDVMGKTEFREAIRQRFSEVDRIKIPPIYDAIWQLKHVKGIVSLNIDDLAVRAFPNPREEGLAHFSAFDAKNYVNAIESRGSRFVAQVHGKLENPQSWIFTRSDISRLLADKPIRPS